jgi:hypothetical protein
MNKFRDIPISLESNHYHQRTLVGPFLMFFALVLILSVGVFYLQISTTETSPTSVPTVRAADGPIKSKPNSPGGLKVPYLGVEVLNPIKQAPSSPVVLSPSPEEPIPFPETPTAEDVTTIEQPPRLLGLNEPTPITVVEPNVNSPVISQPIYRVQIASVRSEREAQGEWRRLKSKYPVSLRRLNLKISRVELGLKGTFYRLLIGPLPDKSAARAFCQSVKKRMIACLVHRIGD